MAGLGGVGRRTGTTKVTGICAGHSKGLAVVSMIVVDPRESSLTCLEKCVCEAHHDRMHVEVWSHLLDQVCGRDTVELSLGKARPRGKCAGAWRSSMETMHDTVGEPWRANYTVPSLPWLAQFRSNPALDMHALGCVTMGVAGYCSRRGVACAVLITGRAACLEACDHNVTDTVTRLKYESDAIDVTVGARPSSDVPSMVRFK